uniref:KIAA1522 n=1 Tax=Oryzias sinensis TaxID=183150 RepID=A0A8C7YX25_9TELE
MSLRMSRRRSTGDLVPKDITEILAREAKAQRGQKTQARSLGQAFNWLRRSKRKKKSTGPNRAFNDVTENTAELQNHDEAGPKGNEDRKRLAVHYRASQHYQENVFIEGSRPRYLEDLHSEAQEGLKIQQQQEHRNRQNIPDNESIASSENLCVEQDVGFPESRSNSRSPETSDPLTHKGSTFKPSSPVKRSDGSKKRVRRTTIMGIPHQVHKELAQSRGSTFQPLGSTQLPSEGNQDQAGLVVIPTVDGGTPAVKKEGARVHLSELEASRQKEKMRRATDESRQDEQPNNNQVFDSHLCRTSNLRPKSVAVPGMVSSFSMSPSIFNFLQEPQGPVMSISPQATYLSTIIPNAVLPASIEVIEIDRCCSRTCGSSVNHDSNVCAVSKNSLTSGDLSISPMVSGSSDGNCSHPGSSHDSALLPTSTSGSNWSESQSSQTITAKPSPASSEWADGGVQENQAALPCESQDFSHPQSPVDFTDSPGSNCVKAAEIRSECGAKESTVPEEPGNSKRSFTRCLSIMKTKQPPAPPRRTNSLHNNKIRKNSRIVVDISNTASTEVKSSSEDAAKAETTKITLILPTTSNSVDSSSKESSSTSLNPVLTSSNQTGEPLLESSSSSPQKTPIDGEKFERTMSPSSGYSSQSGTPTLSPKGICPSSPNDQNKKPIKPERSMSRASSSAASPSSSLTSLSSGTSELVNPDVSINSLTVHHQGSSVPAKELECKNNLSSFRGEITAMLNIPPPPKVKAPSAPPPETWAHNRHSVELLCGPGPNVNRLAGILDIVETESKKMGQGTHENQTNTENPVLEMSKNEANPDSLCVRNLQGTIKEQVGEECPGTEKTDEDTQTGKSCSPVLKEPQNQETMLRKEPPPVMKKPLVMPHRKETELSFVVYCGEGSSSGSIGSSKNPVTVSPEMRDKNSKPTVQTLSVELPTMSKTSPPPTPPPPYHPTPPALRKTPPFIPTKESQELSVVDSCWPPPPPPLEAESAFDRGVEVDFPPPPPPVLTDIVADILDSLLPTAVTDSKPQAAVEALQCASKAFSLSAREDSSQTIEVSPPPVELPPASPVSKAGSPESVPPVIPDYSFPKQMPQKPDYQTSADTQVNSERSDESAVPAVSLPPTDSLTHGVNFRRQSSGGYRDTRSKELLSRHKSVPIPKEDANIPLVTPSLLQMVRLRSVSVTEDQVQAPSEDKSPTAGSPIQEQCEVPFQGPQNIPQKPIRKSLSLKSFPQTVKASSMTTSSSSSRLQEAIRMKTAAMSSNNGLFCNVRSPTSCCVSERGTQALKSTEGCDMYKSTASTASFIFSKSTKKVIIETSMEPQASLKQSLAAEFRQMSSQPTALLNGSIKVDKVPPPVAKKPAHGSPSQNSTSCSEKVKVKVEGNGTAGRVLGPTGGSLPATTTRVTADTIETLF